MDPFTTTIAGSRSPILVSAVEESYTNITFSNIQPTQLTVPQLPTSQGSSSRIRRKPTKTYRSLLSKYIFSLRIEGEVTTVAPNTPSVSQPDDPNTYDLEIQAPEENNLSDARKPVIGPSLPLYHPLGHLAQSVPKLDPGLFGLPNPVNIDDQDYAIHDPDAARRASARARRPAAKVRDRDTLLDEDFLPSFSDPLLNGKRGQDPRSNSPRKRRTGAGGGGTKRKRKDDDGDSAYPNPPKRTRNPRGAGSLASPPNGTSLMTGEDGEGDPMGMEGADQDDLQEPLENNDLRPSTRSSRRSRAPAAKRRNSSASETTTTSVSVSIAVNTRQTRAAAAAKVDDTPQQDAEPLPADTGEVMDEDRLNAEVNEKQSSHISSVSDPKLVKDPQPEGKELSPIPQEQHTMARAEDKEHTVPHEGSSSVQHEDGEAQLAESTQKLRLASEPLAPPATAPEIPSEVVSAAQEVPNPQPQPENINPLALSQDASDQDAVLESAEVGAPKSELATTITKGSHPAPQSETPGAEKVQADKITAPQTEQDEKEEGELTD